MHSEDLESVVERFLLELRVNEKLQFQTISDYLEQIVKKLDRWVPKGRREIVLKLALHWNLTRGQLNGWIKMKY